MRGGEWLTLTQAAERLGVSVPTLRRWDRGGRLVADRHPVSNYRRYRRRVIEAFAQASAPDPVPPPIPDLFGRKAILATIGAAPEQLVLVHGPPGIGKSAVLRAIASDAPGPVGWLAQPPTPDAVRATFGPRVGAALLAIDAEVAAAQLNACRDAFPRLRLVCACRQPPAIPGARYLRLDPLTFDAAWGLFRARAPSAPDNPALRRWVALQDGVPLAIEWAAAHVEIRGPLALTTTPDAPLDDAWRALSPAEQSALGRLSVFADWIAPELAAGVADLAAAQGTGWLMPGDRGVRLLGVARRQARRGTPPASLGEARAAAVAALAGHDPLGTHAWTLANEATPRVASAALSALEPHADRWPTAELLKLYDRVVAAPLPDPERSAALAGRARHRRRIGDAVGAAEDIEAAWRAAGPAPAIRVGAERAMQQLRGGDPAGAVATLDALETRAVEDHDAALLQCGRGVVALQTGDPQTALRCFVQANTRARRAGATDLVAEAAGLRGNLHHDRGDLARAVAAYQEAVTAAQSVENEPLEAIFNGYLAVALHELGHLRPDLPGAIARLRTADVARHEALFLACRAVLQRDPEALAAAQVRVATPDPDLARALQIAAAAVVGIAPPEPVGDDSRMVARLVRTPEVERVLVVQGLRFSLPGDVEVDFSSRPTLGRLVHALVDGPRTWSALVDQGWPGERILPAAAERRVRSAIYSIRRAGFDGWLLTTARGYALRDDLSVRIDPE